MKAKFVNENNILKPKNVNDIYIQAYGFIPSKYNRVDADYINGYPYDIYYDIKNDKVWLRSAFGEDQYFLRETNRFDYKKDKYRLEILKNKNGANV